MSDTRYIRVDVSGANERLETETVALRAEVERLSRDYNTARDAHDDRVRENARLTARVKELEGAMLDGVLMLSEMGLDPREKCQMAYDRMSPAITKGKSND
jgi:hypothetical protein